GHVTGVQTCALPICARGAGDREEDGERRSAAPRPARQEQRRTEGDEPARAAQRPAAVASVVGAAALPVMSVEVEHPLRPGELDRSEERRVGKECKAW